MAAKKAIKAKQIEGKEIVSDIRSGMTNSELMAKYKLTVKGLRSLFRKLEASKAIRPSELYGRQAREEHIANFDQARRTLREYLPFPLIIYELDRPETGGEVTDISTDGMKVRGLRSRRGEVKTLGISPWPFLGMDPFAFQAVCRWVRREGENRDYVAGFEIEADQEDAMAKIRGLVDKLWLSD